MMSEAPFSQHAIEVLQRLHRLRAPLPRQELNPGVTAKLLRNGLIESVQRATPYKTKWGMCEFVQLTPAGLRFLHEVQA